MGYLQVRRRRKREEDELCDEEDESRLAAFQAAQVAPWTQLVSHLLKCFSISAVDRIVGTSAMAID